MHLSGTVMEIWRLKDNGVTTTTDRTTNLIISTNVRYVHTWRR